MSALKKLLPGFKATCIIVGSLNLILASSIIPEGLIKTMAEFKIPEPVLSSPHYVDAMFWVFLHMSMIGILIILIGFLARLMRKNYGQQEYLY